MKVTEFKHYTKQLFTEATLQRRNLRKNGPEYVSTSAIGADGLDGIVEWMWPGVGCC